MNEDDNEGDVEPLPTSPTDTETDIQEMNEDDDGDSQFLQPPVLKLQLEAEPSRPKRARRSTKIEFKDF